MDLDRTRFSLLRPSGRIWAIAAVRGDAERLRALHQAISEKFETGDRVVYLGDVIGVGPDTKGTVDEVLVFRRWVLATPPFTHPDDVVVLRGSQEEMWRTLLQIQFAAEPGDVLEWMVDRGAAATVAAYGGRFQDAVIAARDGPTALSQWTAKMRRAIRAAPGHGEFTSMLLRAAVTSDKAVLLVNAGLDPELGLTEQNDRFWWDASGPDRLSEPYKDAKVLVRGADPKRRGFVDSGHLISIDGGCGEGGTLIAACLTSLGNVVELIEI